jgi:hypothetical protein
MSIAAELLYELAKEALIKSASSLDGAFAESRISEPRSNTNFAQLTLAEIIIAHRRSVI